MFIFIGDETNVTQSRQARFFIYGGLIIAADRAPEASNKVASIRAKWDFAPEDELKFDSRSKPAHLSNDEFRQAKNEIVELCHKLEARFMTYAVHHSIARTNPKTQLWLWALNTLICAFDLLLQRENSHGICLVDRFQNDLSVLGTIHKRGVDPKFSGGELPHRLEKVWCYGTVSIDTTHLASMVDVVLGAFRYCVNETGRTAVPLELYRRLRPLMVCEPGNLSQVEEWGLFLRPREIKATVYEQDYEALRERLRSLE